MKKKIKDTIFWTNSVCEWWHELKEAANKEEELDGDELLNACSYVGYRPRHKNKEKFVEQLKNMSDEDIADTFTDLTQDTYGGEDSAFAVVGYKFVAQGLYHFLKSNGLLERKIIEDCYNTFVSSLNFNTLGPEDKKAVKLFKIIWEEVELGNHPDNGDQD